ncbi:MAG: hypothetical protein SFY66_22095 [Oculatellaceae cyanobacterium bins.114]|nr:hypothetical protein [Oculatellaceae cyanobacterium bins.114]
MVQLPNATDSTQSPVSRRHVESPHLWTAAIAGSVGAHLLLLAFTIPLMMRVAAPQSGSEPVPIELVDLTATNASVTGTAQSPDTATTVVPNATQGSPDPSLSTAPTESITPTDSASVLPNPTTESPPSPSTEGDRRGTAEDNSPQTSSPPSSSDSADPSNSADSSNPDSSPGANQDNSTPSRQTTPTQPPGNAGNSQPTSGGGSEGSDLPGVSISQNPAPASFVANITTSPLPIGQARDIPDQIAEPMTQSQEFISDPAQSECIITPEVTRYFGETVSIEVVIDNQGQVEQTFPQELSGESQEYTAFAECLVKRWDFKPAISGGEAVYSNLIVSITISP